jgi:hypothetical protein
MEGSVPRLSVLIGILSVLAGLSIAVVTILGSSEKLCAAPATKPTVSFSEDVLPLLKWKCSGCHQPGGAGYEKSGFDLTSYASLMKGTKFGPVVVPSDPRGSNLLVVLDWPEHLSPGIRMPHEGKKLSSCDRDVIRKWIVEGAQNN